MSKKRTIINASILSQFSHCPLLSMFHSRKLIHTEKKKIHECALRIVYNKEMQFRRILERDNSFTIHKRKLQKLAIGIFKVNNGMLLYTISY